MKRLVLFFDYLVLGGPDITARRRRFAPGEAWQMAALVARLPKI